MVHKDLRISWDPARARLQVILGKEPLDGEDARAVQPSVTSWTDAAPRFTMLVDASRAHDVAIGWRTAWMGWFAERRSRMRVAVHAAKRLDSLTIPVFAMTTGTDIRTFDDVESAEAWLSQG